MCSIEMKTDVHRSISHPLMKAATITCCGVFLFQTASLISKCKQWKYYWTKGKQDSTANQKAHPMLGTV